MSVFVSILPHQAELQEVVGEEDDIESFSSPSPSATTKSLPGTTPESPLLQVQQTELMSTPFKRPHYINIAPGYRKKTNVFHLLVQFILSNLEITLISQFLRLNLFFQTTV